MRSKLMPFIVLLILLACSKEEIPQAAISNGLIQTRLYLPDDESGYYRGTRFDWSGVMPDLEYEGHHFFGQWFEHYNPTLHDAIMGPVEEFAPLGYDVASPGQTFVKIGVGRLTRTSDSIYDKFHYYPIEDHGKWKVSKKANEITFVQELQDPDYSYEYTKTIRLIEGEPEMEIAHTLRNKGSQMIETNMYNHNFFVIDSQVTGPDFMVAFPFVLVVDSARTGGEIAEINDNIVGFKRNLKQGETIHLGLVKGFSNDISDFDITVENVETDAAVRIRGNRPLSKLQFWTSLKTICPETFIDINIEAGQEFTWTFSYEFYTLDNK